MNYIMAGVICLTGSVLAVLTRNSDAHWLWVSDGNVALSLFIAWYLDKGRAKGMNININIRR